MRISITIDIDYDEATVQSDRLLIQELEGNIQRAIANGLLSDTWKEAVVDGYKAVVEKV